jgi:hypothetical protein
MLLLLGERGNWWYSDEVEIRKRKKQGKHKANREINEQIAIKKLNEHEKLGRRSPWV